jgi:2',3'-cyclic-nucleotide 2'-phosphodiesterase (5'-nucleotidase family)
LLAGGLARRATVINEMRGKQQHTLLVDSGGIFHDVGRAPMLNSEVNLKGVQAIGYDAVNVSPLEFQFGLEYLRNLTSRLSIPFVSANLDIREDENSAWFDPYRIRETGGVKVAITGVLAPETFHALANAGELAPHIGVQEPAAALNLLVPRLREKADVVVLLSHLGKKETDALLKRVPGIDIAITGCTAAECRTAAQEPPATDAEPNQGSGLLCAQKRGLALGMFRFRSSNGKPLEVLQNEQIALDDEVVHDAAMDEMILAAYKERRLEEIRKNKEELHKKYHKGLSLTPREFMRQQQQENREMPERLPPEIVIDLTEETKQ